MKKQTGITVVSLIITIVLMLMLAGVTVTVSLNGGLFEKTKDAVTKTQRQVEDEELLEAILLSKDASGNIDKDALDNILIKKGWIIDNGWYTSPTGRIFDINIETGEALEMTVNTDVMPPDNGEN